VWTPLVAVALQTSIVMILLSSFVFGLVFGSFLNVIIYRLKSGGSIGLSRSFCPECKITLKWYDLVPVFSFVWLRGRCRYCGEKISWQYPIVEILSGLIWVLLARRSFSEGGGFFDFTYYIFILSALLVIAVYDFKWKIIPNKIVYPAIAFVFLYNVFNSFKLLNLETFIYPLFTAIITFLFFFAIYHFSSGKAMGLGDAKLAFLIGLFLGPIYSAVAFTLSFIIGAVFGILLIASKKKSLKSQIAFGPFLVLGAFLAFFFPDFIIKLLNF